MSNLSKEKSKKSRKLIYKRRPKTDGQLLEESVNDILAEQQFEKGTYEPTYVKPAAFERDFDLPRAGKAWRELSGAIEPESEKTVKKIVTRKKEKLQKEYPLQALQDTFAGAPECPPGGCWDEKDHKVWLDKEAKSVEDALTREAYKNYKSTKAYAKDYWYTNRHPELFGGEALTPERRGEFDAYYNSKFGSDRQTTQPPIIDIEEPIEMDPETIEVGPVETDAEALAAAQKELEYISPVFPGHRFNSRRSSRRS